MAVYTELSFSEIAAFLALYNLAPLKAADGIQSGVENTNYRLTLENGEQYILTLFEKRVAAGDLPFFAGLMEQLAAQSVPCPMPIIAKNGKSIQALKNKPALIVTFLPGKEAISIQAAHLAELGKHLAKMHLAADGFALKRPNTLTPPALQFLAEKLLALADAIAPGLASEIAEEIQALETLWPTGLPTGVIHADIFPDNVFFEDDRLSGIIDFYFACNDMLMYELAICLNAWCFEKTMEFNITKARSMLRGYNDVRPISEKELAALPILARGAALRFLLTRAHDWLFPVEGALVTAKDPMEYVKKLRFHQKVKHHGEYGL